MRLPPPERWIPPSAARAAGLLMLLHFALLCALKWSRGIEGEMLWVSHAGLLMGGLGLTVGAPALVTTAFLMVATLHVVWNFDAAAGVLFGRFPLGLTRYLCESDALTLAGTSHHFYLAPVLGWYAWTRRSETAGASVAAWGVIMVLAAASRVFLPPSLNVNLAHAMLPDSGIASLRWYNSLPAPAYLGLYGLVAAAGFVCPAHALLKRTICAAGPARREPREIPTMNQEQSSARRPRARRTTLAGRAFTLIELIAVLVVLAVLGAVAIPRYFNFGSRAKDAADNGSIAGINTALSQAYIAHRVDDAASSSWITSVGQIAAVMQTNQLPLGITVSGTQLLDQRGNTYDLTAETGSAAAKVTLHSGSTGS